MQSKQYDLCLEVLRRLQAVGVLPSLVLIGSWCLVVYRKYFRDVGAVHAVKTRDMDFLVPPSAVFKGRTSVPDLLKDLGFITGFRGEQGAMMLEHPELLIEFMVLDLLDKKREISLARDLLGKFPRPWRKSVLTTLSEDGCDAVAAQLTK